MESKLVHTFSLALSLPNIEYFLCTRVRELVLAFNCAFCQLREKKIELDEFLKINSVVRFNLLFLLN